MAQINNIPGDETPVIATTNMAAFAHIDEQENQGRAR
jgi:hypothetical protein